MISKTKVEFMVDNVRLRDALSANTEYANTNDKGQLEIVVNADDPSLRTWMLHPPATSVGLLKDCHSISIVYLREDGMVALRETYSVQYIDGHTTGKQGVNELQLVLLFAVYGKMYSGL